VLQVLLVLFRRDGLLPDLPVEAVVPVNDLRRF
jgi:hypothetical protein